MPTQCSDDVVAHVSLGRRMARRLHAVARFVELYGGHMIIRERVEQVSLAGPTPPPRAVASQFGEAALFRPNL